MEDIDDDFLAEANSIAVNADNVALVSSNITDSTKSSTSSLLKNTIPSVGRTITFNDVEVEDEMADLYDLDMYRVPDDNAQIESTKQENDLDFNLNTNANTHKPTATPAVAPASAPAKRVRSAPRKEPRPVVVRESVPRERAPKPPLEPVFDNDENDDLDDDQLDSEDDGDGDDDEEHVGGRRKRSKMETQLMSTMEVSKLGQKALGKFINGQRVLEITDRTIAIKKKGRPFKEPERNMLHVLISPDVMVHIGDTDTDNRYSSGLLHLPLVNADGVSEETPVKRRPDYLSTLRPSDRQTRSMPASDSQSDHSPTHNTQVENTSVKYEPVEFVVEPTSGSTVVDKISDTHFWKDVGAAVASLNQKIKELTQENTYLKKQIAKLRRSSEEDLFDD